MEITCHAGPAAELKPLLKELADEGIFMRELDTKGQAFHSPMLAPSVADLRSREHICLICSWVSLSLLLARILSLPDFCFFDLSHHLRYWRTY